MNRPRAATAARYIKSGWRHVRHFLGTPTARLAASYLLVVMVMSLSFSVVSYNTSSRELGRQIPPSSLFSTGRRGSANDLTAPRINDFLQDRIDEGRHTLLARFILVNLLVLASGAVLSYYLARRTLQPIEDSMEAQAQFISDASHELRTPLTAIQTTNEVALRDKKMSLNGAKTVIRQNVEEVAKLKALTDGLLTLARHEADGEELPYEPVSVQDIASDAMNRVMPAALEKHIAIDDQTPQLMVFGDRQALAQALVILLDNAIKYSPERTTVYVTGNKRSKQVVLSVRDEGPGIRPYDMRKIFDRFYRADQSRSAQHVTGHGIGLALAKKIVEQHGGEISVASSIGKGSTFSLKLPVAG